MKPHLPLLAALTLALPAFGAAKKEPQVIVLPGAAPGSEVILLGTETVRQELGITSLQEAVLDSIRNEYRDAARKVVAGAGETAESKKQAQKKLDGLQSTYDGRALRALNSRQRARLVEIEHQLLGGYMLLDRGVQRDLGITQKQLAKIAKIWDAGQKYASKVNGWFENGEISFYERLLYLREDRLDRSDDFIEVLTPEQDAKFQKLTGDKFVG